MRKSEISDWLTAADATPLLAKANEIKEDRFGKKIILRGIIEFSNFCRCHCQYCGIHARNNKVQRYRFSPEHIEAYAKEAYEAGYKSIILQSGEDTQFDVDKVTDIIGRIKNIGDVVVTLSIGERPYEEYRQWKEAGADRYLLKHETADELLYNKLHPHSSFRNRVGALNALKDLGYQVGSGFMVGLPGQTLDSIVDDIVLLEKLEVDMAGIGIYIPHPNTPIYNQDIEIKNPVEIALRAVAITRHQLKKCHLPSTTSLEVGAKTGYSSITAGANVIMKKVEPYQYRKLYEIYPNNQIVDKSVKQEREEMVQLITNIGLEVEDGVC